MNDTPESDEVFGPGVTGVRARKCRDLERRLTVAREALVEVDKSLEEMTYSPTGYIRTLVSKTLASTAPKP